MSAGATRASRACGDLGTAPDVPSYTLLERLGQGGMGEVFLACHNGSAERVAVKILSPSEPSNEPELRRRFDRETRLLTELTHPNIVRVLDHGVAGGRPYLVMEHVSGGNLRGRMPPGKASPVSEVRRVVTGVVQALVALEERQIVHRDLKPENVLLTPDGRIKLADFGISAVVTEIGRLTCTAQTLGTLDYMAPEQRTRLDVDTRADQFSLAVVVYELLTGKRPVGNFKPPSLLNPQLHPAVDAVLLRALSEDPDDRFDRVSGFASSLDQALRRRPRVRLRPVVAASAFFLLGLGGVALVIWKSPPAPPTATDADPPAPVTRSAAPAPPGEQADGTTYFLERGDAHLSAGRDREAESCYSEAIRLRPRDPLAYLKRAYVYKKRELYQKALDDLRTALDLDPTRVEAWTGRGSVYVQLEDYARAVPEFDQALAVNPRSAEALAWRGRAHYKLGREELAREDFDASLRIDDNLGIAYQFRALQHLAAKDYARARNDLEGAVRCMPDNPHAHAKLADLLAMCPDPLLRDPPRAVAHARRACELTQWQGWDELRYLAKAHAANGDFPAAVEACEKSLRLAPDLKRATVQAQLTGYRKRLDTEAKTPP